MICMFKAIHDVLRTLEICVSEYMNLILQSFFQLLDYHGKQLLKKLNKIRSFN